MTSSSRKSRVLVAMSGGVDSSVAAALLVEQGYDVIGATMQVWDYSNCDITEGAGTCCSSLDVDDARAVADQLKIPFYVLNCEEKFKEAVIDPFVAGYLKGQTPVPCVNCNTFLKFDHLIRKMHELECDFLATGHYAQMITTEQGLKAIRTSTDDWKDQTYFLFTLEPEILPRLLFPVGGMKKPDVRKYAEENNLISVARKKDSTGICFVGNAGYSNFVESQVDATQLKPGWIRRFPSGEKMAEHKGVHRFTYGQSRGLGMDHHEKLFVLKLDPVTADVWVGDEQYLYSSEVFLDRLSLMHEMKSGDRVRVKIRYQHRGSMARIERTETGVRLQFDEPQRAVTPGQAAVFYQEDVLLGGGWIVNHA